MVGQVTRGVFDQANAEISDFNSGGRSLTVEFARPEARLLLGEEPREGMVTLQVAEVLRSQTGGFLLRDTYVPPVVRVGGSEFLGASIVCHLIACHLISCQM